MSLYWGAFGRLPLGCRFILAVTRWSINVLTLRQAQLVPGWVTVFGRVNHLGAEPGIQVYSA